jgi:hypothetical protein
MRRARPNEPDWPEAIGLTVLLMLAVTAPLAHALWQAHQLGWSWMGRSIFSPGDTAVYLDYIAQAIEGNWLFSNRFDLTPQAPALHGLWLMVGWLASALKLTPLAAYQAARLALTPILAATAWLMITELLPPAGKRRPLALALVLFGGGVGLYTHLWQAADPNTGAVIQRPVDLWVAEAFPFLSASYSPHFVAAWILFLLTALLIWQSTRLNSWRCALGAGGASLLLATFHPYHLISLTLIFLIWSAWLTWTESSPNRASWRPLLVYLIACAPAWAYHAYKLTWANEAAVLAVRSQAYMPDLMHWVIGYGGLLPLAALGWYWSQQEKWSTAADFLAVWAVAQLFASYSPFLAGRRLLLGLHFPLAVLAALGLAGLYRRLSRKHQVQLTQYPIVALMALLLLLGNLPLHTLSSLVVAQDSPSSREMLFFSPAQTQALDWIRNYTEPTAVVLAVPTDGHRIAGWAHRSVMAGHWANTADLEAKTEILTRFYETSPLTERQAIIRDTGAEYLYCSPISDTVGPCPVDGLEANLVYDTDGYRVYQITPQ